MGSNISTPINDDIRFIMEASKMFEERTFRQKWVESLIKYEKKCAEAQWSSKTVESCLKKARILCDNHASWLLPLSSEYKKIFRTLSGSTHLIHLSKGYPIYSYIKTLSTVDSFSHALKSLTSFDSEPSTACESNPPSTPQGRVFIEDDRISPRLVDDSSSVQWVLAYKTVPKLFCGFFLKRDPSPSEPERGSRRNLFWLPNGQLVAKLDDSEQLVVIPHYTCWTAVKLVSDAIIDCFTEENTLYINTGLRALKYSWKRGAFLPLGETDEWTCYRNGLLFSLDLARQTLTLRRDETSVTMRLRDPLSALSESGQSFGPITGFRVTKDNTVILIATRGQLQVVFRDPETFRLMPMDAAFESAAAFIEDVAAAEEYVTIVSRHQQGVFYHERLVDARKVIRLNSGSYMVGDSIATLK